MVPPDKKGRALAVLLSGTTVATIAGVPGGAVLGTLLGWRATFWAVAALCLPAALGILKGIPAGRDESEATGRPALRAELAPLTRPPLILVMRVDAILEDWGHPDQEKRYIDDKGTIERGGDLGVTGHIGWFVPTYFAEQHPDVTDWKNLNKYAEAFRTAESGDKGQLMDGSPSYVTNDKALVDSIGLDYQVVFAGSEAAQITQIKQFAKERKPFLTYWYKPQWLFEKVPMTEMKLPAYEEGCDADPEKVACAYPHTPLQKFFNARFAEGGGDAAAFLKRFRWTTDMQNDVALMIAEQKLTPQEAAGRWVKDNEPTWRAWLPS